MNKREFKEMNKYQEHQEAFLFQELADEKLAKPTEEEIIKEWENEGFEIVSFTKEKIEIYKQWIERFNHCSHHTFAEICIEKDFFYITGQFSNKYTQLLIKTFKWLGWEV